MSKPDLEDILMLLGVGAVGYGTWLLAGTGWACVVVGVIFFGVGLDIARSKRG
jgi:hypothetical protein